MLYLKLEAQLNAIHLSPALLEDLCFRLRNKKICLSFFWIVLGVLFLPIQPQASAAAPPPISINLNFGTPYPQPYSCRDKIVITIEVKNTSKNDIRISKDFFSQQYFLNLRIIDPAGRLLRPVVDKQNKYVYPHPLGYTKDANGKLVLSSPCKIFKAQDKFIQKSVDLNAYYNFELPGYYSAQVQISVMEFKDNKICNPKDYKWLGVIKSRTEYFRIEDKLPVRIMPSRWKQSWQNGTDDKVIVQIPLNDGWQPVKIDKKSIMLNKLNATAEKVKNKLEAYFNGKDCIESLEKIEIEKSYRVRITGSFASGSKFCGSQKIIIIP